MTVYDGGNTTGFASPAADCVEKTIDMTEYLDLRRPGRYPVQVQGNGLQARSIRPGDILIVDAGAPPAAGRVAVVMLDGAVLVAELVRRGDEWWLMPGTEGSLQIKIEGEHAEIWGIATSLVRPKV